jgi:hypothetical protein
MQLWTDYEGVTIDGAFPLRKLLMPEGRSAFFSTAGTNGEPTVARVIECHFDEDEILARWRCIDALHHPNFLKFERFGQTEIDGRPVVYAVFETVDGNLAEVLDHGVLTLPDVAQLASSLVAALDVLHIHGFIHEHVEPRNIFAINSVVKLRGDCIREAPEGDDGRALKQRDVHDLAAVLLQALTQRDSLTGLPESSLPAPYGQIIRHGLDGTWDLEDIRAALGRQFGANQTTPSTPLLAAPRPTPATAPKALPAPAQLPLPLLTERTSAANAQPIPRNLTRNVIPPDGHPLSLPRLWIAAALAALLLLLAAWFLAHALTAHEHRSTQPPTLQQPATPATDRAPAVRVAPPAVRVAPARIAPARPGWRVIAFTYNHRADAARKASDLARTHPDLQPVVFTPTGHAPYLVCIGGVMDSAAAHALARRSRSLGLPHDLYAQNYTR